LWVVLDAGADVAAAVTVVPAALVVVVAVVAVVIAAAEVVVVVAVPVARLLLPIDVVEVVVQLAFAAEISSYSSMNQFPPHVSVESPLQFMLQPVVEYEMVVGSVKAQ
jgi:hypothetical protein